MPFPGAAKDVKAALNYAPAGWVYAVFHPIDAWHMRRKIKEFRGMLKSLIENRRKILKKESEDPENSQGQIQGGFVIMTKIGKNDLK